MVRLLVLAILFLGVPQALAEDERPGTAAAAEDLIKAYDAGNRKAFEDYFDKYGNWWLVAYRMVAAGRPDAAIGFAKTRPYADLNILRTRIPEWAEAEIRPEVLEAWNGIEAAFEREAWRDVLFRSAEVDVSRVPFLGIVKALYRGMAKYERESYAECIPILNEAVKKGRDIKWYEGATHALWHLGHAQQRIGAFEDALESWTLCAALYNRRGLKLAAAMALGNLGALSVSLADNRAAAQHIQTSLQMLREFERPKTIARTLLNLGWAKEGLGEYAAALRDGREGRRAYEDLGDVDGMGGADILLATVFVRLGDYAQALEAANRALKGFDKLEGDRRLEGLSRAHGTLGLVYLSSRQFRRSIASYDEAVRIAVGRGDKTTQARAEAGLATAEGLAGEWSAAIERLRKVGAAMAEEGDLIGNIDTRYWIGEFQRLSGKTKAARAGFRETLMRAREIGHADTVINCLLGLTEIHFAAERYARAMARAREAVEVMSRTVRGLSHEQGALAREPRAQVISLAMQSAAKIHDAENFSFFLECARAGTLLETLKAREGIRAQVIPQALRAREERAHLRVGAARARMHQATAQGDFEKAKAYKKQLDDALDELDEAVAEIRVTAKASADVLYPRPAALSDIRASLAPGEALVEYAFAGEHLYALVAARGHATVVKLGDTSGLDAVAEKVARQLATNRGDANPGLQTLYEALVKPLPLPKGVRRIHVLPDSHLQRIPMRLLVGKIEPTYVPSGTTVLRLGGMRKARGKGVLALGDPVYSANALRPAPEGVERGGRRLTRLPATRVEVEAVGTNVLIREAATEAALRAALAERDKTKEPWRAVHLACHGGIDPEHPMRSWLALTPAGKDDGFLTGSEVLGMRLDTDLAVLSACESGSGKVYAMEGLLGLTRAFLIAGAPRMLVSLWKVDDKATLALMKKFYELWNPKDGKGVRASTALYQAQDFVRSHKEWAHPYYWAAWVLWGIPE